MRFFEVLNQVIGLLVREGRVTYQALQLEFDLDETFLEGIRAELVLAKRVARDENGTVLVWTGVPPAAALPATSDAAEYPTAGLPSLPPLVTATSIALAVMPHDAPTTVPEPIRQAPEAERRQVTVMFCDLVDSTKLAQQLDPEDYRAVVRAYQETAVAAMQRWDGYVAQYLGDGLMVYFDGSPYHQNSALYPVITHVEHLVQFNRHDPPDVKLDKLEQQLQMTSLPRDEVVPLFAALLSVPLDGRYPALSLTPQQQKQQTLDALVSWLVDEAERQPVLVVWENVHWVDPSTLELLGLVLEQTPTVPMLHVLTFRPEFTPPWPMRSHLTPITLSRLERLQVEAFITHLARGKALPAEDTIAFATEQGFALWKALGMFVQGWALATQGQAGEDLGPMRQGLRAVNATGNELSRPLYLALLAEACGKVG